jgi:ubiquinone/menaquinone biosynthesis C-methylase UbiE
MPTLKQNVSKWGADRSWTDAGNEWSVAWGGADKQWYGSILPRILPYLPAHSILEIAPGFGRWTRFLRGHCKKLIAVDLNANCIDHCRQQFGGDPSMSFYVNDGKSLAMAGDASIDFIFSFDSLVHVEAAVIDAYLAEFARVLAPQGTAFIHHSNFADCLASPFATMLTHIPLVRHLLWRTAMFGVKPNYHWRAESVSANIVRELCQQHNLYCIRQEIVNWGGDVPNDCFSVISRLPAGTCEIIENLGFMDQAEKIKRSTFHPTLNKMRVLQLNINHSATDADQCL